MGLKESDALLYQKNPPDYTLTIICDKCGTYMYFNQISDKRDNNMANFGLYLCPQCAKDILLNNNFKGSSTVQ